MQDTDGDSALHLLAELNARTLMEEVYDRTLRFNHNQVLLPNRRNKRGETPLHIAARKAYLPLIQFLPAHGADVNARDQQGRTPLMVFFGSARAAGMTHEQAAPLIAALLSGSSTLERDHEGRSVVDYARKHGKEEALHSVLLALNRQT